MLTKPLPASNLLLDQSRGEVEERLRVYFKSQKTAWSPELSHYGQEAKEYLGGVLDFITDRQH